MAPMRYYWGHYCLLDEGSNRRLVAFYLKPNSVLDFKTSPQHTGNKRLVWGEGIVFVRVGRGGGPVSDLHESCTVFVPEGSDYRLSSGSGKAVVYMIVTSQNDLNSAESFEEYVGMV